MGSSLSFSSCFLVLRCRGSRNMGSAWAKESQFGDKETSEIPLSFQCFNYKGEDCKDFFHTKERVRVICLYKKKGGRSSLLLLLYPSNGLLRYILESFFLMNFSNMNVVKFPQLYQVAVFHLKYCLHSICTYNLLL